jgi:Spy/CpxP family protein refolding chaperone
MKTRITQTRSVRLIVATAVFALAGGLAQVATAMPFGGGPGGYGGGYGPGYGAGYGAGPGAGYGAGYGHGHHGGPGAGMMGGAPMGRMLDGVNASAEQKAKIQAIMEAARTDVRAMQTAGRALHEQSQALFAQPSIDARQAEALRQQMLAHHDQVSKRMLQARLDAANVLTPEQRKQWSEQMTQRRALMERHRAEREALGGPRRP